MRVDKSKIIMKIGSLVREIEALEEQGFRLMDSKKAQQEIITVVNERSMEFDSQEFSDLIERAAIAGKDDHIKRLMLTREADLMKVDTRYVITDEDLVCPSGFNTADRVFLQTRIAIHCDEVPTKLPYTDRPLKVFDLNKAFKHPFSNEVVQS